MNIYNNRILSYLLWRLILRNPRLRLALTKIFMRDEDVQIELFGASLWINKIKEIGYWRAYKSSKSSVVFRDEAGSLVSLALILGPGDTFIDAGANVGLYSSVLSKLANVFPDIKFYAFEPNADTAKRLRQSLHDRNVQIFNFALSDKNGDLEFVGGATSGVFGPKINMSGFQIEGNISVVKGRTLDSLDIDGDAIVLKIDVEGHERQVVNGALGLFKANRIKAVYLDGYSDQTLPEYLRAQGFIFFDGRTLKPATQAPEHSLLAMHKRHLSTEAICMTRRSKD